MMGRDIIAVIGFLAAVTAAAVMITAAAPWGARAQRTDMPVIGFLITQPPGVIIRYLTAFRCGLQQAGYIEGRHVRIEYRWADGDGQKAIAMASELESRRAVVIAATGPLQSLPASPGTMSIIPTLSIARSAVPGDRTGASQTGRNLTGVRFDIAGFAAKRLELLQELMPPGGKPALLVRPDGAAPGDRRSRLALAEKSVAERRGAVVLRVGDPQNLDRELDDALAAAVKDGVRGLVVSADPRFTDRRDAIVALAAKHGLVALYPWRRYVEAGGLASYGPDLFDVYRQVGLYAGQILKGAQPGVLPVIAPRKWDLVINRKAAAALHVDIPPWIIARANEVID